MHTIHKAYVPLAILLALGLVAVRPVHAQTYTFTTRDVPGSLGGSTIASGINDAGQIVGQYMDAAGQHGFLYTPGAGFTSIDAPAATGGTYASGINNAGQIVGNYYDSTGSHGFLYTPGTGFTPVNDPAASAAYGTNASGINNAGQIVGDYLDSTGNHGFVYTPGTGFTALDDPLGANGTYASGINSVGQIVGDYEDDTHSSHGFLYTPGIGFASVDGPATASSHASGINSAGQIVGYYEDNAGVDHGFLDTPGTGFTPIDDPIATAYGTAPSGINTSRQITGYYRDNVGTHGFVAAPLNKAHILWHNPDGRATLWVVNPDGSFGISQTYGPYADAGGTWQATALAMGPDGVSRLLWRNPDGQATLWRVNADSSFSPGPSYGPYTDTGGTWQAVACSVGPDSVAHILWRNPDGQATLWSVNADSSFSPGPSYGPYTDGGGTWQATALATGPDGVSRILWRNPDGQATLWRVNADSSFSPGPSYGPYTDAGGTWQATAVSVGPDSVAHILWRNPDGQATLWRVNPDGSFGISQSYGPYTDAGGTWQAAALAMDPSGVSRILWRNPDGQATLWQVNADRSFSPGPSYGPYSDAGGTWQAVADSAGP